MAPYTQCQGTVKPKGSKRHHKPVNPSPNAGKLLIAMTKPESYQQAPNESGYSRERPRPMKHLPQPAAVSELQNEFLRLKRKAAKRKADRDRASHKRTRQGAGANPKAPAPRLPTADRRTWPPEEKAAWATRLCIWIMEGGSVTSFARTFKQGPALATWWEWIRDDATIMDSYVRARECSADVLAEECVAIADSVKDAGQFDSARVNAARLMVDARKWVASKLKPKTYADRLETVTSGALTVTHSISDDDRARALATLLTRQTIAGAQSLPDAQRLIEARAKDVTPK